MSTFKGQADGRQSSDLFGSTDIIATGGQFQQNQSIESNYNPGRDHETHKLLNKNALANTKSVVANAGAHLIAGGN